MAELIPLEYRVSVARKRLIGRWLYGGALVVVAAAVALSYTYVWRLRQARELVKMEPPYTQAKALVQAADDLKTQREVLADRMAHIQRLQTDTVLVSLLHNVASAFTDDECLKIIRVDAHPLDPKSDGSRFQVQIRGVTVDDTSHSRLLDRLTDIGRKSQPAMKVNLGEKHLSPLKDGEAISFDLTCEPLLPAPVVAKAN